MEKILTFYNITYKKQQQQEQQIKQTNNYNLVSMGNMDETPVRFDMPTSKTVNTKVKNCISKNCWG